MAPINNGNSSHLHKFLLHYVTVMWNIESSGASISSLAGKPQWWYCQNLMMVVFSIWYKQLALF